MMCSDILGLYFLKKSGTASWTLTGPLLGAQRRQESGKCQDENVREKVLETLLGVKRLRPFPRGNSGGWLMGAGTEGWLRGQGLGRRRPPGVGGSQQSVHGEAGATRSCCPRGQREKQTTAVFLLLTLPTSLWARTIPGERGHGGALELARLPDLLPFPN